jgi:hypothetical protein
MIAEFSSPPGSSRHARHTMPSKMAREKLARTKEDPGCRREEWVGWRVEVGGGRGVGCLSMVIRSPGDATREITPIFWVVGNTRCSSSAATKIVCCVK